MKAAHAGKDLRHTMVGGVGRTGLLQIVAEAFGLCSELGMFDKLFFSLMPCSVSALPKRRM